MFSGDCWGVHIYDMKFTINTIVLHICYVLTFFIAMIYDIHIGA